MNSYHYDHERQMRSMLIDSIGHGKTILVMHNIDKGHRNGAERHEITDTGIIYIYNEASGKLVTTLIARPGQIERYYKMINKTAPKWLIAIAYDHWQKGYNI